MTRTRRRRTFRAPFANNGAGEWDGERAHLLVDFRESRLALDRSLCHLEEKRERGREICMTAGDAKDKRGRRRGTGVYRAGSGGNSRDGGKYQLRGTGTEDADCSAWI